MLIWVWFGYLHTRRLVQVMHDLMFFYHRCRPEVVKNACLTLNMVQIRARHHLFAHFQLHVAQLKRRLMQSEIHPIL